MQESEIVQTGGVPPTESIPGKKEKIKHYANQHKTHADLI